VNKKSNLFLDRWIKYIDDVPLLERPKKYGQTSFYYAYRDLKYDIRFGDLSKFDHFIKKSYKRIK
jgi:hypothetical protein